MKKIMLYAALCLWSALFISCTEKERSLPRTEVSSSTARYSTGGSGQGNSLRSFDANISPVSLFAEEEDVRRAFTLDYSALKPEPEQPAETLSMADMGGPASGSGSGGVMIVPGLRKLENYKTDYFAGAQREERLREIAAKQAAI
ncbi:MAG: hypothetical protein LBR47_01455, partial [Spirochaetaceae bacterium]|nr:hypothetical protein [Spirochaetaceae bacterium]